MSTPARRGRQLAAAGGVLAAGALVAAQDADARRIRAAVDQGGGGNPQRLGEPDHGDDGRRLRSALDI